MAVYDRILKHYLILALESAGVKLNGDCYTELDTIAISLEHEVRRIVRDEIHLATKQLRARISMADTFDALALAAVRDDFLNDAPDRPGEYVTGQIGE